MRSAGAGRAPTTRRGRRRRAGRRQEISPSENASIRTVQDAALGTRPEGSTARRCDIAHRVASHRRAGRTVGRPRAMPQLCRHPRHPVIGSIVRRRAPGIRIERVDLCARRRRRRRHDGRDPAGDHRGGRQATIHAGYRGRPAHLQGRPRHP